MNDIKTTRISRKSLQMKLIQSLQTHWKKLNDFIILTHVYRKYIKYGI